MGDLFETYGEMLEALKKLTPEQLKQRPQVVQAGSSNDDGPVILQPAFCIDTVHTLFETDGEGNVIDDGSKTRSYVDGKHHPDAVVILTDISGYEDTSANYAAATYRRGIDAALQSLGEKPRDGQPKMLKSAEELLRGALRIVDGRAERKKQRMLKECV
jgi:hypothetical protein